MTVQPMPQGSPRPSEKRRANLRLALVLASLAAVFALGFVVKIAWFNG